MLLLTKKIFKSCKKCLEEAKNPKYKDCKTDIIEPILIKKLTKSYYLVKKYLKFVKNILKKLKKMKSMMIVKQILKKPF